MNIFGTSDSKYDSRCVMSDVAFRTPPPIGGPSCLVYLLGRCFSPLLWRGGLVVARWTSNRTVLPGSNILVDHGVIPLSRVFTHSFSGSTQASHPLWVEVKMRSSGCMVRSTKRLELCLEMA